MAADRILLVEDKHSLARMLIDALGSEGFEVDHAPAAEAAFRRLSAGGRYLAVVTDLRLPSSSGLEVLSRARQTQPDAPVIVMTAFGTIETAVEAMKLGAYDFIQKPFEVDHLVLLLDRCREIRALRVENLILREEFQKRRGLPAIVGDSPSIEHVSRQIQKVAPTESTVLLLGESGTGKELFARAIHELSGRRDRPFVAINCAAIPDTLIENELFGHEKGAFTGATGRQMGKFELAEGGTVFLDEIGELGLNVQSKLLRVLQERTFERIGGRSTIDADVRIICATNRDLQSEVEKGRFRDDLFFRINVLAIEIPPLRERKGDIDALAAHFLGRYGSEMGKETLRLSDEARERMHEYPWPGNVRELENCIERAAILCDGDVIGPDDLAIRVDRSSSRGRLRELFDMTAPLSGTMESAMRVIERARIDDALQRHPTKTAAAAELGVSVKVLSSRMKELGIDGKDQS